MYSSWLKVLLTIFSKIFKIIPKNPSFITWVAIFILIFISLIYVVCLGFLCLLVDSFQSLATAALHRHSNPVDNNNNPSSTDGISSRDLKRLLPQFRFSWRGGEADECVVCLDSIKLGQWCRKLPGCGHVFHRRCVDPWLVKVPTCPICRARVRLGNSVEEEERNGGWGFEFDWRNEFRVW